MSETWVKIIIQLIPILLAIITGFAVPLIKAKTTLAQRENALFLITTLCKAAEQIYRKLKPDIDRKQWVIQQLKTINIKLTEVDIEAMIEAAVFEINNSKEKILKE
jgi:hypothetical protein